MNWYLKALKQYADFQTRASLREYWMFYLFNCIAMLLMILLDNMFGTTFDASFYGVFYSLYAILIMIPGLAITVRRLHDIGKSGWMILVSLIPIIGAIWLLILMVRTGDPGTNQYGLNPNIMIEG